MDLVFGQRFGKLVRKWKNDKPYCLLLESLVLTKCLVIRFGNEQNKSLWTSLHLLSSCKKAAAFRACISWILRECIYGIPVPLLSRKTFGFLIEFQFHIQSILALGHHTQYFWMAYVPCKVAIWTSLQALGLSLQWYQWPLGSAAVGTKMWWNCQDRDIKFNYHAKEKEHQSRDEDVLTWYTSYAVFKMK